VYESSRDWKIKKVFKCSKHKLIIKKVFSVGDAGTLAFSVVGQSERLTIDILFSVVWALKIKLPI